MADVVACDSERWLPVDGWDGYEVSDLGRVRSWKQRVGVSGGPPMWRVDLGQPPRILQGGLQKGYRAVLLTDPCVGRKNAVVGVMVLTAFVGPRPPGLQAAHDNGDRRDDRLTNLAWKTPAQNGADKIRHGTAARGEKNGNAKLTASKAAAIRAARAAGESSTKLAKAFGVSDSTVLDIGKGRVWCET